MAEVQLGSWVEVCREIHVLLTQGADEQLVRPARATADSYFIEGPLIESPAVMCGPSAIAPEAQGSGFPVGGTILVLSRFMCALCDVVLTNAVRSITAPVQTGR